jgi:hypothetical protein
MKRLVILFFSIIVTSALFGQGAIEKKRKLNEKIFFGASLGFQFGDITAIEIAPTVGYIPVTNLYVGVKGEYAYYKDNTYNMSTDIYGGSIFCMYDFYKSFLAYGEYELLSLETAYFDPSNYNGTNDRYWEHTPLIGGGYLQSLGGRSKIMLLVLWNLNESYKSYYANPVVKISFLF